MVSFNEDAWDISLVIIAVISSILSIFGSLSIVYLVIVVKKIRKKQGEISLYNRIMVGLSCSDCIASASALVQTAALWTPGPLCQAGGFLSMFFLASYIYTAELSLFFLLMVRSNGNKSSERSVRKLMEPTVHILPFALTLAFGTVALAFGLMRPTEVNHCLIVIPESYGDCFPEEEGGCASATAAWVLIITLEVLFMFFAVSGITCTWLVYATVRNQYRRIQRSQLQFCLSDANTTTTTGALDNNNSNASRGNSDRCRCSISNCFGLRSVPNTDNNNNNNINNNQQLKRMKLMQTQAILYTCAFLSLVIPSFIDGVTLIARAVASSSSNVVNDGEEGDDDTSLHHHGLLYAIQFLIFLFFPLQGFFNMMIYLRPQLCDWKKAEPNNSWLWAYRQVMTGKSLPQPTSSRRLRRSMEANTTNEGRGNGVPLPSNDSGKSPGIQDDEEGATERSETNSGNNCEEATEDGPELVVLT